MKCNSNARLGITFFPPIIPIRFVGHYKDNSNFSPAIDPVLRKFLCGNVQDLHSLIRFHDAVFTLRYRNFKTNPRIWFSGLLQ